MDHKMRLHFWKIKDECWSREVRAACIHSPALQGKTIASTKNNCSACRWLYIFLWKSDNFYRALLHKFPYMSHKKSGIQLKKHKLHMLTERK